MRKITLPIIVFLLAVVACAKEEERVLARVGEEQVKVKDFLAQYRPQTYPSEEAEREAKLKVLEQLINDKLMEVEARSRGYASDTSLAEGIENTRKRALVNALYMKEVVDKVKVSRADIKRYYDADRIRLHLRIIHMDSDIGDR